MAKTNLEALKNERLKLENQLCFALYAASKEVTRLYKSVLDPLGITYTQYLVLIVLWEYGDLTVTALGKKLYLASNTLTPLLKKLESMALIERVRDAKDERSVKVRLTEQGKQLKIEALDIPGKVFCHTGLTPDEAIDLKKQLKDLLEKL